jgi:hypothetical protein
MPKFRVIHRYTIKMVEEHIVEINEPTGEELAELHAGGWSSEEECFRDNENTFDYLHQGTLVEKTEGDCVGEWRFEIEEINALDQIVEALEENSDVQ